MGQHNEKHRAIEEKGQGVFGAPHVKQTNDMSDFELRCAYRSARGKKTSWVTANTPRYKSNSTNVALMRNAATKSLPKNQVINVSNKTGAIII